MRKHQLVSSHVKFELVYISSLPKSIACTEQVSYRGDSSQHQCRRGDLSPRCIAAICRIVCLGLKPRLHGSRPDKFCTDKTDLHGSTMRLHWTVGKGQIFERLSVQVWDLKKQVPTERNDHTVRKHRFTVVFSVFQTTFSGSSVAVNYW